MSKKSLGVRPRLGGRERGEKFKADNLIPACVAWYVGDRGRTIENHALKLVIAKLLNDCLLVPATSSPYQKPVGIRRSRSGGA